MDEASDNNNSEPHKDMYANPGQEELKQERVSGQILEYEDEDGEDWGEDGEESEDGEHGEDGEEGEDDEEEEEEDKDESSESSGNDPSLGGSTVLKLHGIHSGMNESKLRNYVSEMTQGLKKVEILVEMVGCQLTQAATLYFETEADAQGASTKLSGCPLGPGGTQVKVDLVSIGKMESIPSNANDEQQSPSIETGSQARAKRQMKPRTRRPRRHPAKATHKSQESEDAGTGTVSLISLEVRNIGVKKENFQDLLTQLKIPSFHSLQWKASPEDNRAFLMFETKEAAISAQKILNNCSIGSAEKILSAIFHDRPITNPGAKRSGKQQRHKFSKKGQSEHPSSHETALGNVPNISNGPERNNVAATNPPACASGHDGGRTRVQAMSRNKGQQNRRQQQTRQAPSGASNIPYGLIPTLVMDNSPHALKPRNETLPSLMEVLPLSGQTRSTSTGLSNPLSHMQHAKFLEVTNIDKRITVVQFWEFLTENGVPLQNLEFSTGMLKKSALIHFATEEEARKSRRFLNHHQIFGQKIYANFIKPTQTNVPPSTNMTAAKPNHSRERGDRPPRHHHGRNDQRRNQRRTQRRSHDDELDKLSESSETVSIASSVGKWSAKSDSLHITNIEENVDEDEFVGFLNSLDIEGDLVAFRHAIRSNTQFAMIQFPDSQKATDAKSILDSATWMFGFGDSRLAIKVSYSRPKHPRGRQGRIRNNPEQLEGVGNIVDSRSNVQNWLGKSKPLSEEESDQVEEYSGYGQSSQQGTKGLEEPCEQMSSGSQVVDKSNGKREKPNGKNRKAQKGTNYAQTSSKPSEPEMNLGEDPRQTVSKPDSSPGAANESPDKSANTNERRGSFPHRSKLRVRGPTFKPENDVPLGNPNARDVKVPKSEYEANQVIISGLPKDIIERDVVERVKKEDCEGFKDARLIMDRDSRARKSTCLLVFTERKHAMNAVSKLYGKPIKDHRIHVHLAINHEEIEPAIARQTLTSFQKKEMPDRAAKIKGTIEERIQEIESKIEELQDVLAESQSFAESEQCESSIMALLHQTEEQQRFLSEFGSVRDSIDSAAQQEVSSLSEVQRFRQHFERECRRAETPLPVYGYMSEIQKAIKDNQAVVLKGETGSGKSTQIPQYIVDMELYSGHQDHSSNKPWRVACTQPRRVAALTLAKRVAEEYGCRVGEEIGSFVGNKKSVSNSTIVTFMTDRKLLNLCMADPNLTEYTCVIVDEAHERSVDTDILLATLKQLMKKRSDLHLLIMSATIDITLFTNYLDGCKRLSIPGRTFPVDKHWCSQDVGIGEGDYVGMAVQQAVKIHREEDAGDILVFLTSANEIERACRDLAAALNQSPDVLILPLHGRLQPEDQMKVFAETSQGERKIVFATNVAETSITIKGIKYVIDPGVVKECQYDPKRSMSLLKVTSITRASAEQRAGRAGRTAPGICYRMYTKQEYSELEETMKPEILRVHLGMAALQLLELGVEDVENFDFIEAPDREAIKQAMTTLRLLGAVDEQAKMTSLGQKMATLPLEPRLSKIVLEGVKMGIASEAVVLAALISAPGSVFYRGGSDKEKKDADRLKLQFCHESGDAITMLGVYGQWNNQPENKQKAWCMANSINSKTLRATKETVKEISDVLRRQHDIACNPNDKTWAPDMTKSEALQKVIMSAYFQTLSLFNGHRRAGYTVLTQQKSAHIHPSAALRALDSNPQWVVYEEFKRTSQDFLINVTQVDISWLKEVAPVFFKETNLPALQEIAMQELPSIPLGTALIRQISAKRNEKLRELEEGITAEQDAPCIIEINRDLKELHVFVSRRCWSYAESRVDKFLQEERQMMERQQIEVPVGESGVVRQVIVAGGQTKFVLMAEDYRALEISDVPAGTTEDKVESIVRFAGCSKDEVLDVYRFPKHSNKWGRVTFVSPEAAESAKEWLDVAVESGEASLSVRKLQGRPNQNRDVRQVNLKLVVTWFTWPSKGYAFINCEDTNDAFMVQDAINDGTFIVRGSGVTCLMKRNDTRALFIGRISKDARNEDLEAAIKERTDVKFKCSIARAPPSTITPPQPDQHVRRDIYAMFDGVAQPNEINVDVMRPRSERTQMQKAIVTFSGDVDDEEIDERIDLLQDQPRCNSSGQMYYLKATASCMLFCKNNVYQCLRDTINTFTEIKRNVKDLDIKIYKSKKTSDWIISVSGENMEDVKEARQCLLSYIQGETVLLAEVYPNEIASHKKVRLLEMLQDSLDRLVGKLHAYTFVDRRRQAIVVFGDKGVREKLKIRLRDYVDIICSNLLREIPLTAGNSSLHTKGRAIRALVRAYGPWLKKLQDESGSKQITLNTHQGVLLIEGDPKVFDKARDMVQTCLREAGLEEAMGVEDEADTTGMVEEVECGVCYTDVEGTSEIYRLSSCSHAFHQDCLKEMFRVRLAEACKDYPIECPYSGCGAALLLCDIRILCPNENNRLRLSQWALEAHVTQKSNGQLKFCPTADCCMVYQHTDVAKTFVCPECRIKLCSSCDEESHRGQTCSELKISRKKFDDIEVWMKGKDVKKCPHCGVMIEKNSGCNNMTCTKCHHHICWICLEHFINDGDCYDHLSAKHGGCFNF